MRKLILILVISLPLFALAGKRYVTVAGAGNKDGSCWQHAYEGKQLQKAIDDFSLSTGYDTVFVAKGTYNPMKDWGVAGWKQEPSGFHMADRVTIFGGFAGNETSYTQRKNFGYGQENQTILDGGGWARHVISNIGTYGKVLFVPYAYPGPNSTAVLDGFVVQGGNAPDLGVGIKAMQIFLFKFPHDDCGGGMVNFMSSPTIRNVTFINNSAFKSGGAIANIGYAWVGWMPSSPTLINVLFISNSAPEGSAISTNSDMVITNSTFGYNGVSYSIIDGTECNVNLKNCIIWGLYPNIVQKGGSLSINYCCFPSDNIIQLSTADFLGIEYPIASLSKIGNIYNDPCFVNPAYNDYRIMGHSPCVNAGENSFNYQPYEIRGKSRKQLNTIDIGAYEYSQESDPIKGPFYVNGANGDDNQVGLSWATAKRSLQTALNLIRIPNHKEEIWVRYGTYYPTQFYGNDMGRYNAFQLHNNLSIYGGFFGNETSPAQRRYFGHGEPMETILSGERGITGDNSDNCYHIFFNPSPTFGGQWEPNPFYGDRLDSTAVLDGFTITGGNADSEGSGLDGQGGGMYNYDCSPILRNLTFLDNNAEEGGAMRNNLSSPDMSNILFKSNTAGVGGGMSIYISSSSMDRVSFVSNSAVMGGGIFCSYSSPNLTNAQFISNVSINNFGGGMRNHYSSPILTNTLFESNTASYGGGMSNDNSSPSLANCSFRLNQAVMDGGAIFNDHNSNPVISSVTFTSNSAGVYGGAISNSNTSNPVLTHVHLTSNSAGKGGAISNSGGSQSITNATFASNSASESGGAVYNWGASPSISHSKFISNTATDDGGAIYNYMGANPVLTNDTIVSNQAGRYGGGMGNYNSSPTLTNVAILSNTATNSGGGLNSVQGSNPQLINNTIVNNNAKFGGGICNSESSPTLNNTIVWGNTVTTRGAGRQFYLYQGTTTLNYSCFPNTDYDVFNNGATFATTNHNINLNPRLVDVNGNDPRILGSSPCKNNGLDSYNTTSADLAGRARIQETHIDMGACEFSVGDPQVAIIYVDASRPNDSGDGKSWATAKKTLQSALDRADGGYQIWVKKGTYFPTAYIGGTESRYLTFQMKNDMAIYGGFNGTETALNERCSFGHGEANETIISGNVNSLPEEFGDDFNSYHLFYHTPDLGLDSTAILDGFTVQGGNADGDAPHNLGGAMYNAAASPTIRNVAFLSNSADSCGGTLFNFGSSPRLTNVVFSSGSSASGGAIYNEASSPVFTNVTFSENNATLDGGAIFNYFASNPVLNNCILWGNSAARYGHQVYLYSGTMVLNYSCYPDGANDMAGLSAYSGTNNIHLNPQFVNSACNDLRILGSSPCKNSGLNGYNTLSTDIRGQSRIQNSTILDPLEGMLYVDASMPDDSKDGRSWANAKKTLGAALSIAGGGYQVRVKAGTYYPTDGTDRSISFTMKNNMKIFGGFSGADGEDIDTRTDFGVGGIHETILSGDIGTPEDDNDNSYHLFYHPKGTDLDSSAVLDGFTIQNGNADDYDDHSRGGGMFNYQSSPTIRNVTFLSNNAFSEGGAMYNGYFSSPFVSNTLLYANSANYGGGIANDTVSGPVFTNATIAYNNSVQGGGLYNGWGSRPVLNNCIIWGNTAADLGKQFYSEEHCFPYLNYSCYSNETNDVYGTVSDEFSSSIFTDPLFLDTIANNYLLYGNSPCVGAGKNEYNETYTDLRGQLRIQNDAIDMGAYEWTGQYDPSDKILFVDASKPDDNGNGYSWATAKKNLQAAIDLARDGYQVWVKKGTYTPTKEIGGTGDRYKSFQLKDSVAIYGGFEGNEDHKSFELGNRNFESNETVLSGDIGTLGDPDDNCYHVLNHPDGTNLNSTAILYGFTITGGNADGAAPHNAGGGMYNSGSSPTLSQLIFRSNNAVLGGGVFNKFNELSLSNSLFTSNTATSNGGALYNINAFPTLTNVTLTANSARNGGGIFNTDNTSIVTLKNCIFWGNQATNVGNQLYLENGSGTFQYTCYANATNDLFIHPDATFDAFTFCITSDPIFTDAIHGKYTLFTNSPCVNMGNNSYPVESTDIRGQQRIQNEAIDMGAYEWTDGIDPETAILYVDAMKDDDTGDGLSWPTAKKTLQAALDRSVMGFEIWVKAGTYYPTKEVGGTGDRYKTFSLKDGVNIYGGFLGNETSVSERNYFGPGKPLETFLSGDIGTKGDLSDNCYHVVRSNSGTSILDGFTITGGNASGTGSEGMGGGLFNEGYLTILNNVAIVSNSAIDGGGLYATGYGNYTNCYFTENTASGSGGGVYVYAENTFTNCLINDNTANNGGGAYAHSGGHFINCTFTGDSATTNGGGIYANSGGRFTNCILWKNTSAEIYTSGTGMVFLHCSVEGGYSGEVAGEDCTALLLNPFVSNSDYSLNKLPGGGEVCWNTGTGGENYSTCDLAGNPRDIGGIDRGAYEYTGCVDHYVVRTDAPTGPGSLLWAVNAVCDGATISFDTSRTIILTQTLGLGNKSLTIESNGWDIVLDGNGEPFCGLSIQGESDKTYIINELTINNFQWGGGLAADMNFGTLHVNQCIFSGNQSEWIGGGASVTGNATFTNCTFSGNTAVSGGGVAVSAGSTFINCLFSNNTATSVDLISSGGGAYITDDGTFINCTFSGNHSETGGGISIWDYGTVSNCLFWNNGSAEIQNAGGNFSYCAAPVGFLGTENGNVILSASPFAGTSDFRLDKATPDGLACFNAGLNSMNTAETDLRGRSRIQIDTIDIGAYEWTFRTDPGNYVGSNLSLADEMLYPDEVKCINAYDTITVAGGDSYVVVAPSSSATFIAGKSILFLPGFLAVEGSFVNAHITTDGSFCETVLESPIVALPVEKSTMEQHESEKQNSMPGLKSVKLFPNPNNGRFTISLTNIGRESTVSVYNILGVRVYSASVNQLTELNINLPELRKGIYFVRIVDQEEQYTKKMIVN
jgi:predicted outer membrane repeat protein